MGKFIDLTGQKFGRLTVIERSENRVNKNCVRAMWECRCECGNTTIVEGNSLRNGHTKSCGCLQKERVSEANKTHGQWDSRLYRVWNTMIQRCENKNSKVYHLYGENGRKVCEEWHNFETFFNWAVNSGYEEKAKMRKCTLERIDNNKGYSPDNCKWVTQKEQSNNTRRNHLITYKGKTQTMAQWAEEYNISYGKLNSRINTLKWNIEKALTTP